MKLSAQQTKIIVLVANGSSIKEAAVKVGISERTARSYMGRAYLKLGAKTQAHAIAIWVRSQRGQF